MISEITEVVTKFRKLLVMHIPEGFRGLIPVHDKPVQTCTIYIENLQNYIEN
jgi:hypothetical protein